MDAEAFDRLARSLAHGCTRNGLLALLAGLPLVSTIVTSSDDAATALDRAMRPIARPR